MRSPFPKSPFPVTGHLSRCWLFTFREPAERVAPLLPAPLELIVRDGFAYWNVVICEIEEMRPAGLPAFLGVRSRQVAYRLYVRCRTNGIPLEGLHFLRSECDSVPLAWAGNALTDFHFRRNRVHIDPSPDRVRLDVRSRGAAVHVEIDRLTPPALDPGSPFSSIYEAKAVLAYKPAAFNPVDSRHVRVLSINRDEAAWQSQIVHVDHADFEFFRDRPGQVPEICYEVAPIEYRWNAARTLPVSQSSPNSRM